MIQLQSSQFIARWVCLVAYLFVAVTAGGAVLCEGFGGHVAIEVASLPCPTTNHQDADAAGLSGSQQPCTDTPISLDLHDNVQKQSDRVKRFRSLSLVVPPFVAPPRVPTSTTVWPFNPSLTIER